MKLVDFALKNRTVTWFLSTVIFIWGIWAYVDLGKLEDPTFTVKTAVVVTAYPGASALEVEEEVTEPLESAIQKLSQLEHVRSLSRAGMSMIYVDILPQYTKTELPQIWDELRRKIGDAQRLLPTGAGPSMVNDSFGDVYGFYLALTGDGFRPNQLEDVAKELRRKLFLVSGVADIQLAGVQQEVVYLEISRSRLAQLGLPLSQVSELLQAQNLVLSAGTSRIGEDDIRIAPTGYFSRPEDIADLVISGTGAGALRVRDIATVKRGYMDPPLAMMRHNGRVAVGLGISATEGTNVITLGQRLRAELRTLENVIPVGMELDFIYDQGTVVDEAIRSFIRSLIEAVLIVIVVLLFFMGLRSGLLIGAILLLTILGTFIVMKSMNIELQSISLGALILALGMLVDNAIVVVDGILSGLQQKKDPVTAAKEIVTQTQMPLLGATVIAVLCFAPIGLSPDNTGEYCRSLFQVLAISLMLSWFFAITTTAVAGVEFLRPPNQEKDPYDTPIYRIYRRILEFCLRRRGLIVLCTAALLVLSIQGFGHVRQGFFPNATTPMFLVDFWQTPNAHIKATMEDVARLEKFLLAQPEVEKVTGLSGQAALRFILTYTPQDPAPNYGHLLVRLHRIEDYPALQEKLLNLFRAELPHVTPIVHLFSMGSGGVMKIEARLLGEDAVALRRAGDEILRVFKENPDAVDIMQKWRERGSELRPRLGDVARKAGVRRAEIAQALQVAYSGARTGVYREADKLLPIISRLPEHERLSPEGINETQVWNPSANAYVPLGEMIEGIDTIAVDPVIYRRDRLREFLVQANSVSDNPLRLFSELREEVEKLSLPEGVSLEWAGDYEASGKAMGGLMGMVPLSAAAIMVILVMLFNGFRQPLIILACLPLSIIGVTVGFLVTGKEFDFVAILGFLSLMGLLIKNAIVLLDQIDLEIADGNSPYNAILSSGLSRARPVMMASLTTVLGVIPLYTDILYGSLSVLIMFGLTFATLLTLLIVPVLCALWMKA